MKVGPNTHLTLLDVYRQRADEAHRDSERTTLANVKERCLRAEAAWNAMADRLEQTERMRLAVEKGKAAMRAGVVEV